jgi:hypothetical protein
VCRLAPPSSGVFFGQSRRRREKKALNRLSMGRSLRRSIKGGPGWSVAALRAIRRCDRRRLRGRMMYVTTAQKNAKKITTKTVSTRVPSGGAGLRAKAVLAIARSREPCATAATQTTERRAAFWKITREQLACGAYHRSFASLPRAATWASAPAQTKAHKAHHLPRLRERDQNGSRSLLSLS